MSHPDDGEDDAKPLIHIKKSSPNITMEMASKILTLVHKGMLQHHVAALFGVNQGRVSEIVTGKRFAEAKPVPPDQLEFRFE